MLINEHFLFVFVLNQERIPPSPERDSALSDLSSALKRLSREEREAGGQLEHMIGCRRRHM